jgi:hypothetical protein
MGRFRKGADATTSVFATPVMSERALTLSIYFSVRKRITLPTLLARDA